MKTTKLIPMSDFVLSLTSEYDYKGIARKSVQYAQFLKQPIELWMFVPCDEDGNVLEEPYKYMDIQTIGSMNSFATEQECSDSEAFHKAKEKVLFENAVNIDTEPYRSTKRLMINLNHKAPFRIYNKFKYGNGDIEINFLPQFSIIPTIEYLVQYNLQLTPTALKQIYR